jgi:hypothetical protein
MLIIVFIWLLLWVIFTGIGFLLIRLFLIENYDSEIIFSSFWLGFSIVILILQIWHLAFPIRGDVFILICIIGLISFFYAVITKKNNIHSILNFFNPRKLVVLITFIGFMLWLANHAMGEISPGDAGLYHIGMVRWVQSYPIIRGLGNLHGRFAFNNSYFLFLAFLDILKNPGFYNLSSGLIIAGFIIQSFYYSYILINKKRELRIHETLGLLLSIPVLSFCLTEASSTSPDLPIFILGAVVGISLFKLLFVDRKFPEIVFDTLFIVILSSIGITIKLSFVVYGLLTSLISFLRLVTFIEFRNYIKYKIKGLMIILVIAFGTLLFWGMRGVILSGYVAYPSTLFSFDYQWKVHEEKAQDEAAWIQSWARDTEKKPEEITDRWEWLIPTIQRTLLRKESWMSVFLPIILFGIGLLLFFTQTRLTMKKLIWVYLSLFPTLISLIFWLFTVPSIRFAGVSIWMLSAGTLILAGYELEAVKKRRIVVVLTSILMIVVFFISSINQPWIIPPGNNNGYYSIPNEKMQKFITTSGLILYVPITGNKCWDAPLPCTPYPDENLALIENGDMSSGFMIIDQ